MEPGYANFDRLSSNPMIDSHTVIDVGIAMRGSYFSSFSDMLWFDFESEPIWF